ncbi:hypothetical protein [Paraburkholderia bannensis]|uniref:hypothetical protein n=1 Tax=Paraburkholderia bannensis TaxID=765414 RepID=UPI002AAFC432|nr:hypothetical protein [Paraburkholderia bannensis]
MANVNTTSQPGPGRQWFEKTLIQQRDGDEGIARLKHALRYWFRRDTLTPDEAFPLLIGIDPGSLADGDSHNRFLDGSLVCVAASMLAHGIEWAAESFGDVDALQNLQAVPVILDEMKRVWDSGEHPSRNAPIYFIKWAQRKGFNVPWLESARDPGLIEKEPSATASDCTSDAMPTQSVGSPVGETVNNCCAVPVTEAAIKLAREGHPLSRQRHQEHEILRVIRQLGYDPAALPKRESGRPWVKKMVREQLKFSPPVFDKAWERLRSNGEIREQAEK